MPTKSRYLTSVEELEQLSKQEKAELKEVADKFNFCCNDYYLSLIDWNDPSDPIRKIIIPDTKELQEWGRLDPSNEKAYTIMPGLEHKYNSTALLLVSNVCEGMCRYCFRKRIFIDSQQENCLQNFPEVLQYIEEHNEITNVLLTGGDPLAISTSKLENVIKGLREIDHVEIIRIGTRMPAFNPHRILEDTAFLEMLNKYSSDWKVIYMMTHFIHPRELTNAATKALRLLREAGVVIANQAPLIRGVNDSPEVLEELLAKLSYVGVAPYYIFQCRPAVGNKAYTIPIEEGYGIFEQTISRVSGLAKRPRFVMSHSSGKLEVVGMTEQFVYLRYHRAACDEDSGRFMALKRNPGAYWLDDYDEISGIAQQRCPIDCVDLNSER